MLFNSFLLLAESDTDSTLKSAAASKLLLSMIRTDNSTSEKSTAPVAIVESSIPPPPPGISTPVRELKLSSLSLSDPHIQAPIAQAASHYYHESEKSPMNASNPSSSKKSQLLMNVLRGNTPSTDNPRNGNDNNDIPPGLLHPPGLLQPPQPLLSQPVVPPFPVSVPSSQPPALIEKVIRPIEKILPPPHLLLHHPPAHVTTSSNNGAGSVGGIISINEAKSIMSINQQQQPLLQQQQQNHAATRVLTSHIISMPVNQPVGPAVQTSRLQAMPPLLTTPKPMPGMTMNMNINMNRASMDTNAMMLQKPPGIVPSTPSMQQQIHESLPPQGVTVVAQQGTGEVATAANAAAVGGKPRMLVKSTAPGMPVGQLLMKVSNNKTGERTEIYDGYFMRPNHSMEIHWRLPPAYDPRRPMKGNNSNNSNTRNLVIGLHRYGAIVNMPAIATKPIDARDIKFIPDFNMITAYIIFYAPKAAGQFVFRLFDSNNPQETLATSPSFMVILVDGDIVTNFKHVLHTFDEAKEHPELSEHIAALKAIGQFTTNVKSIRSCVPNYIPDCIALMNRCLERIIDCIQYSIPILNDGYEKQKEMKVIESTKDNHSSGSGEGEGDEEVIKTPIQHDEKEIFFWKSFRQVKNLHIEIYEALNCVMIRKQAWYWVSEKLKNTIKYIQALYCPLSKRYFSNRSDKQTMIMEQFGFLPAEDIVQLTYSTTVISELTQSIQFLLPKLIPTHSFELIREQIKTNLEKSLQERLQQMEIGSEGQILGKAFSLCIYGSSKNGFGNTESDLDMCLAPHLTLHHVKKSELILQIASALEELGMKEVSCRATARIPIVEFIEPYSGLSCDISLHNELALANTKLLRIYSEIDPRVRQLAYLIKYWAKRRNINSPKDGTLSSYGYILALLHFLQQRTQPVIPNLQSLPPDWNGEQPILLSQSSCTYGLPVILAKNEAITHDSGVTGGIEGIQSDSHTGECNIYFLQPNNHQWLLLKQQAKQNTETVGQLLIEFFHYYAYLFDYKHQIVSIRQHVPVVSPISTTTLLPPPPTTTINTTNSNINGSELLSPMLSTNTSGTSSSNSSSSNSKVWNKIDKSERYAWVQHNRLR